MLKKYLKIHRNIVISGIALIILIAIASLGYWVISGRQYSFLDAFYMTIITLTTIGYGEIIDLSNNPLGRIFTIVIALTGIGLLTYILTNITAVIVEGKLTDSLRRRRMENKVQKLADHYIICGVGKVAMHMVNELCATKRRVVLIDINPTTLEKAVDENPEVLFILGDATDNSILAKAGIERAAGIFASTNDDNQNLVISLTAKELNRNIRVVAECTDIKNQEKLKKAGADAVVSPTHIGGLRMSSEMVRPTVVSFLDTMLRDSSEQLRVEEIQISNKYTGKQITGLNLKKFPRTLLLAVRREGKWLYNPPENYVIKSGDTLILMTNPQERLALEEIMNT